MESWEINLQLWSNDLQQSSQDHSMGKEKTFNKWCWENWISLRKRIVLDSHLTPYIKIKSKQVKDLNIRTKHKKKTQGKRFVKYGSDLLDVTLKVLATKEKKGFNELHQNEKLLHQRASTEWKGNPQNGGKYLQIMYLMKD